MNIICFLKGHRLADRKRVPPIPYPAGILLVPHSYIAEDYCKRCGCVDNEIGWTFWDWRMFTWPKMARKIKRCIHGR